mmetsp:Transcript_9962/g.24791  ORF Transcript_9962/g.24791 Transcript_9962/m.24791 type:complete len:440 (+) Transcript_9962:41-1360(+)
MKRTSAASVGTAMAAGCVASHLVASGSSSLLGQGWVTGSTVGRPGLAERRTPNSSPAGAGAASMSIPAAEPPRVEGNSVPALAAVSSAAIFATATLAGRNRRQRAGTAARSARLQLRASMCKESDPPDSVRRKFEAICANAQDRICAAIEEVDGKGKFDRDAYDRGAKPGGGVARVLTNGNVFEKAGVNLSVVYSEMPQEALKAATERGVDRVGVKLEPGQKVPFFACGLSSVMHPKNPMCPTMHFNYRYFETDFGLWWFGGGTDITPSYLDEDDMKHFHGTYKNVCDKYDPAWYPKFKKWADDYFFIPHRGETRGLGGIFFDDFNTESQDRHLEFSTACLDAVTEAYVPILKKHKDDDFTQQQKDWQQMRRGRYVEFNLVYDRGTTFGLKMLSSGVGRLESILMSLPQTARWQYNHTPEMGTKEEEIMACFKKPREWV